MPILIYTDGACEGNQFRMNVGGWAYILRISGQPDLQNSGAEANTTNNKMELTACIRSLEHLKTLIKPGIEIQLFSDSEYVVKGMTQWRRSWEKSGWKNSKGEPVKNLPLWHQLIQLSDPYRVKYVHVRGHVGDPLNTKVDELAVAAIRNKKY